MDDSHRLCSYHLHAGNCCSGHDARQRDQPGSCQDSQYTAGQTDLANTGLLFEGTSAAQLTAGIQALQSKGTKVMLSIGGASNADRPVEWESWNVKAATDFVQDFGLDGIDIDFEPREPGERGSYITCHALHFHSGLEDPFSAANPSVSPPLATKLVAIIAHDALQAGRRSH
ncbi:hypothetical protein ACKKBF_B15160 [Auxenochlorella protothecoides x Auxenochlorella symbiontica]